MRDPNRMDPLLAELKEYWQKYPDIRLTQLMWQIAFEYDPGVGLSDGGSGDVFYFEDDRMLTTLKRLNGKNYWTRDDNS